jgi:hypothetical protein
MAIYHLSVTQIKRSKGQSAVAAAAYRAGEKLHDERLDQIQDYTRKRGVVQSRIITLDNAPDWTRNRAELWNKAEAAERQYNGQPAREIRLALPDELTDEQRADLVFDYVNDTFVSRGMIADVSIHRPDRHGDERNHHAHILLTMRELDGNEFAKTKQREWNKSELAEDWREKWADYQNDALEDAGFDVRVDHRTLKAQGIDRDPTRHMGKEASAMERDGIATRIGDENRAALLQDAELDRLKGELAQVDAEVKRQLLTPGQPEPPLSQEELERQAVSAFTNEWTRAYMTQEPPKQEKQPVMYFDNNEVHNAQPELEEPPGKSIFDIPPAPAWIAQIMEPAEVEEPGWYDYTVTTFNLIYRRAYDAARAAIDTARAIRDRSMDYWDSWQGREEVKREQDKDRGYEPDMY